MMLKKESNNNNERESRRVMSDVRPLHSASAQKNSRPQEKRPSAPAAQEPRNVKTRKFNLNIKRAPLMGVIGVVVIALGGYILISSASLTLAVTHKKTGFNLGTGVKLTFDAKEFNSTLSKRGEGVGLNEKSFSEKAKGVIVVYNNFNSESQVLVERTRFQSPEGLIFRSTTRITVPGKTGTTPGSVEVSVVADDVGEKYNIGLTDFSVPGFAGGPKFKTFYGRSKTEMKGGSKGVGVVVGKKESDELLSKLETDMRAELKGNFEKKLANAKEYVTFPAEGDYSITFRGTDPPVGSPGEKFFGEVRGSARSLGIEKSLYESSLTKALFKDDSGNNAYHLSSDSSISFKNIQFDYDKKTVSLVLEGRAIYIWDFDKEDLIRRVLGAKNIGELDTIFTTYPGISRVEKTFKPAVFNRIPKNAKRIIIENRN
jgi:hypothetical protein